MRFGVAVAVVVSASMALAGAAGAKVLRVGSYHGIQGQYTSIQAAVDAAHPGDWILIGPGDYKTEPSSIHTPKGFSNFPAGVLITKAHLHVRGMNRDKVIVDGTKPGSSVCSNKNSAQNLGPRRASSSSSYAVTASAKRTGANGVMVFKAPGVSVQNLTICNFLHGSADSGNEIWFNGGADSGKIGGQNYFGSYLTTTSTFYRNNGTAAQYGIFSSNWTGGTWFQTYASNFSDAGYYIGACQQQCDQTVNQAWGEFSSLGYSGTNSGGRLVVRNSQFDDNNDGFDTDSENGDPPSPQNGACPHDGISPITHTHSCWVFMDNYVHDNNNPDVPEVGQAGSTPVGTGLSLSGARNDTVMHNRFARNNAWGVLLQIQQGEGGKPCTGGKLHFSFLGVRLKCLFDGWGNAIIDNRFSDNGSYRHKTNGDIAAVNLLNGNPTSCYAGNVDSAGLTTSPAGLETTYPACTGARVPANANVPLVLELLCGNEGSLVGSGVRCPGGKRYPVRTHVVMHALPKHLQTMPAPCRGVPGNPWCGRRPVPVPVGLG
jgi:hypothetical protein